MCREQPWHGPAQSLCLSDPAHISSLQCHSHKTLMFNLLCARWPREAQKSAAADQEAILVPASVWCKCGDSG